MKDKLTYNKAKRTLKAFVIGLLAGAAVLCIYAAPSVVQKGLESAAAAIRQENLIPARGEAFDSFAMAEVSLTVLLDGQPRDGISVAADRGYWMVPPDGEVRLSLAPNSYQFTAAFENRTLTFSGEVFAGRENAFVLDVGKAPAAPELRIWEIPAGEDVTIPLEIANADEVTSENLPDAISIAKRDGAFLLLVDGNELSRGFTCMKLTAENEYGQAFSYVGLRMPRETAVTPVYTAEDLDDIRHDLSGHYVLMDDIDMSGVDDWTSIGTESYPFTGVFDGGGHEITGFHAPAEIPEGAYFALFGYVKNAELRNAIFREPVITPVVPARDLGVLLNCSPLAGLVMDSLVENCGSFGGLVSPSDGLAGGLLGGTGNSIVLGCFNSTDVICNMVNRYLPNTGGVMEGSTRGYISHCANEGEVKGDHLTGGIAGHSGSSDIRRCINSGYIWGSTIVGAVPAGGIIQSNDDGSIGYSCFVRGLSAIGAHSNGGFVTAVAPIDESDLRAPEKLTLIGSFQGNTPDWAYASLDADGPVPYGIFKEQAPAPVLNQTGGRIDIPPMDDVLYFYTLDGSDPYTNCTEPTGQLSVTLKKGQTLTVFAAKRGFRDGETVTVTGG